MLTRSRQPCMVYHIVCGRHRTRVCGPWAVRCACGRVCGVTVDLLLEACSELGRTMASIYTVAPVRMESVLS